MLLTSFVFIFLFFAYRGIKSIYWFLLGIAFFSTLYPHNLHYYLIFSLIFLFPPARTLLITKLLVHLVKKLKLLPKISKTETIALTSGDSWIEKEMFCGKPNFPAIWNHSYPKLKNSEIRFLKKEVEKLCKECQDHKIYEQNDLPKEIWEYIKDNKFFGMIIPKKYGGLGFSAIGHSAVIEKLSSRSVPLAITVMVPNSLGPAELLMNYGTKAQKEYFLPKLATGQEIPCFGLTEVSAGSDATSIKAEGIVFRDKRNNRIRIKLNWSKRYITLGSVATLIGLAFKLRDPENILGNKENIGITCALIPSKTKGITQNKRHDPLGTPFINAPIDGKDVIIDLEQDIIGGKECIGKGWSMLMECLGAGRGVSLPSTSSGGIKLITRVVSAHANIRQQFNLPIGKFEAIADIIAKITANNFKTDAIREFTSGAVGIGLKPAVVTAIAKYHSTELFRQTINHGMDILGGNGIIRGKKNLLANPYFSAPISITVEGSNIITRSLIQFGQGSVMCHPYVFAEMLALTENRTKDFDRLFFSHLGYMARNKTRSIILSLTRGCIHNPKIKNKIIFKYERKLAWISASFAYLADIAMLFHGGNLKRKESLNCRFADILSNMYISVAVLKKFQNDENPKSILLLQYVMADLFHKIQISFDEAYQNIGNKFLKFIFLPVRIYSRINQISSPPSDKLGHQISKLLLNDKEFREYLTKNIFIPSSKNEALGSLENALGLMKKNEHIFHKKRKGKLTEKETKDLEKITKVLLEAIAVDAK
jgi:acyl-CoA dehydrogenase